MSVWLSYLERTDRSVKFHLANDRLALAIADGETGLVIERRRLAHAAASGSVTLTRVSACSSKASICVANRGFTALRSQKVQASSPTDRLACAVLTGEKAIHRAVTELVEAGFATESISVIWYTPPEPGDAPDPDNTLAPLVGSGPRDSEDEPVEFDEAQVTLRTGVRRFLPIGAAVGALGGILVVWFGGDPATPIVPQIITSLATGGFLGAMLGIVLGLGQWEHAVDLPDDDRADRPLLIAVDVAAQGREPEACAALSTSGAALVKVCSREEAEQLVREAAASSANGAV